jgi:TnsA endonuclease N terminal
MAKFARGKFAMKHPEKYVGTKSPTYRSSWEWSFMNFCDNNPSIMKWASEAINIPYRDPLTGKQTIYVPDFFIQYIDKKNQVSVELVEIKPASQTILERVGKSKYNQAQFIKNQAKWTAANHWCKQQGIKFRILNENDIFSGTK